MAPDLYEILRPRACLICARGSVDAKHIRGRKLPLQVIRKRCRLVTAAQNRAGGRVARMGSAGILPARCRRAEGMRDARPYLIASNYARTFLDALVVFWTAPAKRSDDGAFSSRSLFRRRKAVWRSASHRTQKLASVCNVPKSREASWSTAARYGLLAFALPRISRLCRDLACDRFEDAPDVFHQNFMSSSIRMNAIG